MTDQPTVQRARPPRNARKREREVLPDIPTGRSEVEFEEPGAFGEVLPDIPTGRSEVEFEEPGAFGERVAEKMLEIARKHFPPASAEKHE
jgi:hypothetical protein